MAQRPDTDLTRSHRVASATAQMRAVADSVVDASVWSMSALEAGATLVELTRLKAQVAELEARVAAHADDLGVGEEVGATSTANWWAHQTRQARPATHGTVRLGHDLGVHTITRDAMASGDVMAEQARVIVRAVDALPDDLPTDLVAQAEAFLVERAAELDARALAIAGKRLLEVIAPDAADAHEAKLLAREEAIAAQSCRLTMTDDGHGTTHGRFSLPTAQGAMLAKILRGFAAPKHQTATEGPGLVRRPGPQRMGRAFCELIERYPADRVPDAGGVNATAVVIMTYETLMGGLKAAHLDTGEKISAGQARRLASQAGIIPVVLGGRSEVLDVGRKKRFHTKAQRLALMIRDQRCTADGCDWPPGMCHAHHDHLWSQGGPTDVEHGRLLCPRHHARAHDPTFEMTKLPGGKVAFHRRT
ncbi:DUF222 domain-containing protein [Nocardioides sp. CN2-186]|uniref:HNH endonuclease signature motif containing protein n=1 Tax=Nocardioides tweenelious TaxID=3156607 RepID=UPI0032B5F52D